MAVKIEGGSLDKEQVNVKLGIIMMLADWRRFLRELPDRPVSILLKDELKKAISRIDRTPT